MTMTLDDVMPHFRNRDGRASLTLKQLHEQPALVQVVQRFPHCFAWAPCMDVLHYYPAGDAPANRRLR